MIILPSQTHKYDRSFFDIGNDILGWRKKNPLSDLDRSLIDLMPNFRFIENFPKLNNSFFIYSSWCFFSVYGLYMSAETSSNSDWRLFRLIINQDICSTNTRADVQNFKKYQIYSSLWKSTLSSRVWRNKERGSVFGDIHFNDFISTWQDRKYDVMSPNLGITIFYSRKKSFYNLTYNFTHIQTDTWKR